MAKEHLVVIKTEDGTVSFHRMKEWLRNNRSSVPDGLDPTNDTSHTLRRGLRHNGWILVEKADKVLLIKPDEESDTSFADELIATIEDKDEDISEKEILEAEEITFGLERDLQKVLRANISQLDPDLTVIDGGQERSTEAGRIDITAKDRSGTTVVIELKAGKANPDVVAQILSYMGSVAETDGVPIRGILVAGEFHKRVVLASKAIPNLQLKQYAFQFTFHEVE